MVDFLDSWVNVVPVWILDNILDQLIFPKLQKEVREEGWVEQSHALNQCLNSSWNSQTPLRRWSEESGVTSELCVLLHKTYCW